MGDFLYRNSTVVFIPVIITIVMRAEEVSVFATP